MITATLENGEVTLKMSEEEADTLWNWLIDASTRGNEEIKETLESFDFALGNILMGPAR